VGINLSEIDVNQLIKAILAASSMLRSILTVEMQVDMLCLQEIGCTQNEST
jgi:hypothetical protein